MRYLTFALTKGRLASKTLDMFEKIGITCEEMRDKDSRKLIFTNEELKLCDKFYYAYRNWKENVERNQPTAAIKRLKDEIAFLKAEYKAVAGCDIKDAF